MSSRGRLQQSWGPQQLSSMRTPCDFEDSGPLHQCEWSRGVCGLTVVPAGSCTCISEQRLLLQIWVGIWRKGLSRCLCVSSSSTTCHLFSVLSSSSNLGGVWSVFTCLWLKRAWQVTSGDLNLHILVLSSTTYGFLSLTPASHICHSATSKRQPLAALPLLMGCSPFQPLPTWSSSALCSPASSSPLLSAALSLAWEGTPRRSRDLSQEGVRRRTLKKKVSEVRVCQKFSRLTVTGSKKGPRLVNSRCLKGQHGEGTLTP